MTANCTRPKETNGSRKGESAADFMDVMNGLPT